MLVRFDIVCYMYKLQRKKFKKSEVHITSLKLAVWHNFEYPKNKLEVVLEVGCLV